MDYKPVLNQKFLESIDDEFIDEFVNVSSPIPGLLMNLLEKKDLDIGLKRMLVFDRHPEYESLDLNERIKTRDLIKDNKIKEAYQYRVENAVNFLKKHPEFRIAFKNASYKNLQDI